MDAGAKGVVQHDERTPLGPMLRMAFDRLRLNGLGDFRLYPAPHPIPSFR